MPSILDDISLSEPSPRELALKSLLHSSAENLSAAINSISASAQINEGALLAFDASLSLQNKADTSNSFLFAQLAADKKYNRHSATLDWVKTFASTLAIVGWTMTSTGSTTTAKPSPADWEKVVTPFFPAATRELAATGMAACQALPADSKAISLWRGSALDKNDGILIAATAWVAGGSLNLAIVGIDFGYQREFSGFMEWKEYFDLNIQTLNLTLNEDIYSQVRETIIAKLGDRPNYLVVNVPLA
jgi:hypothetical protein